MSVCLTTSTSAAISMFRKPSSRGDFRLAIICALPTEYDAVHASLDETWDEWDSRGVPGDCNHYVTGRMGDAAVVLALLPGMGKAAAAGVSASMRSSYINLQYALLVGICGAIPQANKSDILLGDVIVGKYIVPYDFGRQYPDDFRPKQRGDDLPGRLPKEIRILNAFLNTRSGREELVDKTAQMLCQLQEKFTRDNDYGPYRYPGTAQDKAFQSSYRHKHQETAICSICDACSNSTDPVCPEALELSCTDLGCSDRRLIARESQRKKQSPEQQNSTEDHIPEIHVGGIASADTVMKSGDHRDRIASTHQVIAFEMEGAGVWDEVPCIIVKGVCDYADSHKNKNWQPFASATAASTAKAIICKYFSHMTADLPISGQVCHFIPFAENEAFVGRERVVQELNRLLFLQNNKRVAVVGLGGVGKTQVALHLAHSTAQNMIDYSVFWMPAFSMASYEQACAHLAQKLDISIQTNDDSRESLKTYLESPRAGKWLLILDNADDEAIIYKRDMKELMDNSFDDDTYYDASQSARIGRELVQKTTLTDLHRSMRLH
ncbi:hypothetical protein G7Z17_g3563 [Cylindrodendrum hubeiense]|uniref:Nucleoside phosphorylase domain-containing protein n=1 Tax=Cylindrodendrum hubeiense TaxID=595255 RepID=A0A9P5LJV8_9HYPO|nr:hypothetical protein G7Z17_g3563 [Cylindrodendrum hubeiense]